MLLQRSSRVGALPGLSVLLSVLGLALAGVGAQASTGAQYVHLRNKLHCDRRMTYADVQANPGNSEGKVLELRGRVGGSMEVDGTLTVILNLSEKSAVDLEIPRSETKLLEEYSQPYLRALVRVGEGTLKTLAIAHDSEVGAIEEAEAKRQAQIARQQQQRMAAMRSVYQPRPTLFASRGNYNRAALTDTDVDSMARYFDRYLGARVKPLFAPYCRYIASHNARLTGQLAGEITASLLAYADRYNVDPRLIVAMIIAESGFNPNAVSRVGAIGLGQLMPRTAQALGIDNPFDPVQNLNGSIYYLRNHLNNFADKALPDGGVSFEQAALALAAYNAGPNAVKKYGGVPPYRETRAYVQRVMDIYQQLTNGS